MKVGSIEWSQYRITWGFEDGTPKGFADDVRKSSEAGMNGYVTKPLDETRLLRELAQYKK